MTTRLNHCVQSIDLEIDKPRTMHNVESCERFRGSECTELRVETVAGRLPCRSQGFDRRPSLVNSNFHDTRVINPVGLQHSEAQTDGFVRTFDDMDP